MIDAKLIQKTVSPFDANNSIITFELTYPLFIHAELMTHRVFSRNCASARAIPVSRMIELVKASSTAPNNFRHNQSGMEAAGKLSQFDNKTAHDIWNIAMLNAVASVEAISDPSGPNVHKQWANRLLMPFTHMRTVVTSTEWDNWNDLRAGDIGESGAQDEISILANMMLDQMRNEEGECSMFHIPYVNLETEDLTADYIIPKIIKSVARISRISYMRDNRETTFEEDCAQILRLTDGKFHASPFEHIAFDSVIVESISSDWESGNFNKAFKQLRHCKSVMQSMINLSRKTTGV